MAIEEADDQSLLAKIVQERDHRSFAELFNRYSQQMYNTALYAVRQPELAEEAVQEAMLSIWLTKKTPEGNIRNWILSVVTHKGLNLARTSQRSRKREENKRVMERYEPECAADEKLDTEEIFDRLRNHLQELPEVEQQIIAFYYGAGINQSQIAKMLSLPKQTVSYKMQEALSRLRESLTKAGFAAAVPLLSAEGLSHAILTGHEVPPGLTEKVMSRIANTGKEVVKTASRRVVVAKPAASSALIIGGIVLATAAAGGLWWATRGSGTVCLERVSS